METKTHVHEETFDSSVDRVFALLHTPSAIRQWWGAARAIVMPETGGLWTAAWGDDEDAPDYVTSATMAVFDPPHRLVLSDYNYSARSGPLPFEADFVTEFVVEPHAEGALLRVSQAGFPCTPEGERFTDRQFKRRSFADAATEDLFDGVDSRCARRVCPVSLWPVARRKLRN